MGERKLKINLANKRPRSKNDLYVASSHLFFYMDYLSERVELMSRYKGKLIDGGVFNTVNDAFLINARKLIEFLYSPTQIYEDDVVAEDFFSNDEDWSKIRQPITEVLKEAKKNIGKLLAHLTYDASNKPDGVLTWKISQIYVDIFEALQVFLNGINKKDLNPNLELLLLGPKIAICYPQYSEVKATFKLVCVGRKSSFVEIS